MRVKICGITSYEDAMCAIQAGADALGFVFYPPSPRYVSVAHAADIIKRLPPFVEKVGLFVNENAHHINQTCHQAGITLAQIHFDAEQELYDNLDIPFLPVIRAKSPDDIHLFSDQYRLIDAYCEAYGGAGERLNIEWFDNVDCSKIILAGGLDPDNVQSLHSYGFYGVDVSSGVEASKGIKECTKVKAFVHNAKHSCN